MQHTFRLCKCKQLKFENMKNEQQPLSIPSKSLGDDSSSNSKDNLVSPFLETRADINPFRWTHWHHRSDGNDVTRLGNTTCMYPVLYSAQVFLTRK